MIVKTITNFNGGIAEDPREHKTDSFVTCKGFNSSTKDHTLVPYPETEAETLSSGDITEKRISDVIVANDGILLAVGRNSAATPTTFDLLDKDSSTDISSAWTSFTSLSGVGGYRKNSLSFYKGSYFVYDEGFNIRKYDGSWSNIGNLGITSYWDSMLVPKPFIHPLDDNLYFAVSQSISVLDNTTLTAFSGSPIPTDMFVSSLTDFGAYLAIACAPAINGVSRVFLWDRDTTRTTFTENINWGEGSLLVLENVGGVLVGVSVSDNSYSTTTQFVTTKNKKLTIRAYTGGTPQVIKELEVSDTFVLRNIKAQVNGKLYFGGDYDDSLYVVYKDRTGRIVVSKDRLLNNGSAITTLRGFSVVGDYLFAMYDTAGSSGLFYRTKVSPSYTASSTYTTLKNPLMEVGDRGKKKKLHYVSVGKTSTTGQLVCSVSVDGGSYTTVSTLTAGGKLFKKESRTTAGTPFTDGYEFQFKVESTGGAEFTELKYAYEDIEKNI